MLRNIWEGHGKDANMLRNMWEGYGKNPYMFVNMLEGRGNECEGDGNRCNSRPKVYDASLNDVENPLN